MILGDAIYSILSGDATLTGLVGTDIYPVSAPQGVNYPFVVYSFSSADPTDQKDGSSPIDDVSLNVDCYDKTYRGAQSIVNAVRDALDDYSGTAASITIRRIWFQNQSGGDFLEDHGFFAVTQSFSVKVQR